MARAWYLSFVEPTWQMSSSPSTYISYFEDPGAVLSCQGSSFVPSLISAPSSVAVGQAPLGEYRPADTAGRAEQTERG